MSKAPSTRPAPLPPEALYQCCDPDLFEFATTSALAPLEEILGQPRAVSAVQFGLGMRREGYNVFVMGPPGVGKQFVSRRFLSLEAAKQSAPSDWCYVTNFSEARHPKALRLPPGCGNQFRARMEQLVEEFKVTLPAAFESEEYQKRRSELEEQIKARPEEEIEALGKLARESGFALMQTPSGFVFAPMQDGEVMAPDEFESLPDAEREAFEEQVEGLQRELLSIVHKIPKFQREKRARMRELNQEVADFAITPLFDDVKKKYREHEAILAHLDSLKLDVLENLPEFLDSDATPSFRRYQVNVLVSNADTEGAPIVYEDNPTYNNLLGRMERIPLQGMLITDFTLLSPGALHRANGGYLLLNARKMLMQPLAWEGLKRALRARQLRMEPLDQLLSLTSTASLEPEPIPLDVKVVLVGERMLYHLLSQLDPEFLELFKVVADFEEEIDATSENYDLYARMIATLVRKEELLPLTRDAVARVLEDSARSAGDQRKLSTHMGALTDLLSESDYWARQEGRDVIEPGDVQRAIDAKIFRMDRIRERVQESILEDVILLDTKGEKVGQINGLAVSQIGQLRFGRPSRITATVTLGRGKVLDIEREVKLGGPLHSKGVLILSSFLSARYAAERPLPLSASLVFEQSYGGIDGDSASSAELYTLLSAIAQLPIKQSFAVTGSVNQFGEVQAIGGANEKIEGFFDVCKARGLTGEQGVLIPHANARHLMLRHDVVDAVREGSFAIYPVKTIDEGISLLTGVDAGTPDEDGHYPEGSVNHKVQARIEALTSTWLELQAAIKHPADGAEGKG